MTRLHRFLPILLSFWLRCSSLADPSAGIGQVDDVGLEVAGGCNVSLVALQADYRECRNTVYGFNAPVDYKVFINEVEIQKSWWSTTKPVTVTVFDGCDGDSAFSVKNDNEIYFGVGVYRELKDNYQSFLGEIVVLAHEWSHQLQNDLALVDPSVPVRTVELAADFLAGFYLGWNDKVDELHLAEAIDVIHHAGGERFTDVRLYGSPAQRNKLVLRGYERAIANKKSATRASWQDLHREALREISEMRSPSSPM